jgi:hypothetical protein
MEPSFQQIVILDGPSVLSRPLLDNLQDNAGALPLGQGMLRMCLQESMDNGVIEPERAWALAYLISGALENISRVIAMSPEGLKQTNRKILAAAFVRFIERLRIDKAGRKRTRGRRLKKPSNRAKPAS